MIYFGLYIYEGISYQLIIQNNGNNQISTQTNNIHFLMERKTLLLKESSKEMDSQNK